MRDRLQSEIKHLYRILYRPEIRSRSYTHVHYKHLYDFITTIIIYYIMFNIRQVQGLKIYTIIILLYYTTIYKWQCIYLFKIKYVTNIIINFI